MGENNGRKVRKEYSAEFKAEAVRLVESGERSQTAVARNLGIAGSTMSTWCKAAQGAKDGAVPARKDLVSENRRLEAEVKRLKLEQEILKKAAAYFAKNLL
jgi:transposase